MTSDGKDPVLSRFEAQCARREYCSPDIRRKVAEALRKACADDVDGRTERIVASLVEQGFVSDLRYASAFAREKSSLTGWGPVKIRAALAAKRLDRGVIEAALEEVDRSKADDRLEKLLASKWRMLQGDPQARLKLIKFALGRGYEYEDLETVIQKFF